MWQAEIESILNGFLVRPNDQDGPMSFGVFFDRLSNDVGFASWFTEVLAGCRLMSFYCEYPPLTVAELECDTEFALIEAPALTGLRADRQTFRHQFEAAGDAPVAVFDNLSGDARLIVPCAGDAARYCAHLAPFVRSAPAELICDFWQRVGREVSDTLGLTPIWLSTSGLGVSWLHVRLDSIPKYYQYAPYKSTPFSFRGKV